MANFMAGTQSIPRSFTTISSSTTLNDSHDCVLVNAQTAAIILTLPDTANREGKIYDIKKIDSSTNTVTLETAGSETIDGEQTLVIYEQYDSYTILSDGTNWHMV
ncbi:MAG: hypothetical protein SCH70_07815 [Candidatus Methanoperedens sp.]|nr:hypothetical protein [Candidatus Methanoperedens sp.]